MLLIRGALLTVLLFFPSQETVTLSEASAAGDRSFKSEKGSFRFTMRAKVNGQLSEPFRFNMTEDKQVTERVLSATAAGKITSTRRLYHRARERETTPDGDSGSGPKSYEGRTVTLRKRGNRTLVQSSGPLPREDRRELEDELQGPDDTFFPNGPVAVGQSWRLDSPGLAKYFSAEKARVAGKLVEIAPYLGHRSAHVEISVEFSGKVPGAPMYMRVRMSGDLRQSLDIQRILSIHLSGPVIIQGTMEEAGQKMEISGDGRARFEYAAHWYEVAGKPATGSLSPSAAKLVKPLN